MCMITNYTENRKSSKNLKKYKKTNNLFTHDLRPVPDGT